MFNFIREFFVYPTVRVKDCSEKPTARAGRGGKGKARTCSGKPDRRFYQRGERPVNSKVGNVAGNIFPATPVVTPYINPLLRFCCGLQNMTIVNLLIIK